MYGSGKRRRPARCNLSNSSNKIVVPTSHVWQLASNNQFAHCKYLPPPVLESFPTHPPSSSHQRFHPLFSYRGRQSVGSRCRPSLVICVLPLRYVSKEELLHSNCKARHPVQEAANRIGNKQTLDFRVEAV